MLDKLMSSAYAGKRRGTVEGFYFYLFKVKEMGPGGKKNAIYYYHKQANVPNWSNWVRNFNILENIHIISRMKYRQRKVILEFTNGKDE